MLQSLTLSVRILLVALLLSGINGCYGNQTATDPNVSASRLVALLHDPDPQIRTTAAQALGKIAIPGTASALLRSLHDDDPTVRAMSAWALGNLGEDVLDQAGLELAQRLDDPSAEVKQAAAQALGAVGGTQSIVGLLTERLASANVESRRAAVSALTWLEADSAYHALTTALGDPDARVRQGAVAALGEMVDPRSLPAIRDRLLKDADAGVRGEAAYRLGKFGDRTIVPALRSASTHDRDAAVQRWAAWALEQIEPANPLSRIS
ncbi:MAG TPA: HEAT repeat domain-containing protein [Nitrospiraceae bacterium]|nr:HEAT repeat domain-containing protein [Nitrospiraceae bacterium]